MVHLGFLTKDVYNECLKEASERLRYEKYECIALKSFMSHLSLTNFNKHASHYFLKKKLSKGEMIFPMNESNLYSPKILSELSEFKETMLAPSNGTEQRQTAEIVLPKKTSRVKSSVKITKKDMSSILNIDIKIIQGRRKSSIELIKPNRENLSPKSIAMLNQSQASQLNNYIDYSTAEVENAKDVVIFIIQGDYIITTFMSLEDIIALSIEYYKAHKEVYLDKYQAYSSLYMDHQEIFKYDIEFEKYYKLKRKLKLQRFSGFNILGLDDCFFDKFKPLFTVECESSFGEFYQTSRGFLEHFGERDLLTKLKKKEFIKFKTEHYIKKLEDVFSSTVNFFKGKGGVEIERYLEQIKQKELTSREIIGKPELYRKVDSRFQILNVAFTKFENRQKEEIEKVKVKRGMTNYSIRSLRSMNSSKINFVSKMTSNLISNSIMSVKEGISDDSPGNEFSKKDYAKKHHNSILNFGHRISFLDTSQVDKKEVSITPSDSIKSESMLKKNYTKIRKKDAFDVKLDNTLAQAIQNYVHNVQIKEKISGTAQRFSVLPHISHFEVNASAQQKYLSPGRNIDKSALYDASTSTNGWNNSSKKRRQISFNVSDFDNSDIRRLKELKANKQIKFVNS